MEAARDNIGRGNGTTPGPAPRAAPASGGDAPGSHARARPSPHQRAPEPPRPTLAQVIDALRAAFSARFHLFELEAKRAAWSAAYMMAFAVGAALLGVTAWLILIGALIVGAVNAGVPWILTVVIAIALHAVGVFLLVRGIRSMVSNLTFSATRRTLSNDEPSSTQNPAHGRGT